MKNRINLILKLIPVFLLMIGSIGCASNAGTQCHRTTVVGGAASCENRAPIPGVGCSSSDQQGPCP